MALFSLNNEPQITQFSLTNKWGTELQVCSLGARMHRLICKDHKGEARNILLSAARVQHYQHDPFYLGATVGPCANRIAFGKAQLNQQTLAFSLNQPPHHLHGGEQGLHAQLWHGHRYETANAQGVCFRLAMRHKDYPGQVFYQVTYELSQCNRVDVNLSALSCEPTIINLTNHAYFNLGDSETILNHRLYIPATQYHPMDGSGVAGEHAESVSHTPFDFTQLRTLDAMRNQDHAQIHQANGWDHHYQLAHANGQQLAAVIFEPQSQRSVAIYTDAPGFQLYTGQYLHDDTLMETQQILKPFAGLCIEPQAQPNAINTGAADTVIGSASKPFTRSISYHINQDISQFGSFNDRL